MMKHLLLEKNTNMTFPSTRFLGSKSKLIPWIYQNIKDLEYRSVLDAFGGTASFSFLMKKLGKRVYYNDYLKFNQIVGKSIIENQTERISNSELMTILTRKNKNYRDIIVKNFRGIYFKDYENKWLDYIIQNIYLIKNQYKRSILLSALFQACLIKRPFNLFHRNNLNLRTNDVTRTFGNKTSWDRPFKEHFIKFVQEYNNHVFNNFENNKVIGGFDVLEIPKKKYDLVYLDPPYLSKNSKINYLDYYHFLEGISDYYNWEKRIDYSSKLRKFKQVKDIEKWTKNKRVEILFKKMINRYKKSIIVLSYRNDGVPTVGDIMDMFQEITGKKPIVKMINHKYALSNGSTKEVLFISKN